MINNKLLKIYLNEGRIDMKKFQKLILSLTIATLLGITTGCEKKEVQNDEGYKSKEEVIDNVQSKKKVTVDGEEMDEYTLKDGMKIQGADMEEVLENSGESE